MGTLKFLWTITRPVQVLTVGVGTWVSAIVLGHTAMLSTQAVSAAITMALLSLFGSLFHAGFAKVDAPYVRSSVDVPAPHHRRHIVIGAVSSLACCLGMATTFLTIFQIGLVVVTATVLFMYTWSAGQTKYWFGRNLVFAYVTTTPILVAQVGALASTNHVFTLHEMQTTWILSLLVLCAYFARETMKSLMEAARRPIGDVMRELHVDHQHDTGTPVYLGGSTVMVICMAAIGGSFALLLTLWPFYIKEISVTAALLLTLCLGGTAVTIFFGFFYLSRPIARGGLTAFTWIAMMCLLLANLP
ncbi:MAG: hypothetical protein V1685_05270 [Parcubacteria group bacterium]